MLKKLIIGFLTVLSCGLSVYLYVSNVNMDETKYGASEVILFSIPLSLILIYVHILTLPKIIKNHNHIRLKKGMDNKIEKQIYLPEYVNSPLNKNDKIGEVVVLVNGKRAGKANLIVVDDIKKANAFDMMKKLFKKIMIK